MIDFTVHTIESAPEASKPLLQKSLDNYGFVPNLHGVMAASPEHLETYQFLGDVFQRTSLTPAEQNVVWLTINVEHECHYCVPAHSGIAKSQGVEDAVIEALREKQPIPDAKLEALRQFTQTVVQKRGRIRDAELQAFLDAGYTQQNVLEILVGAAHKLLSNYVNAIAHTPVDEVFGAFAWSPKEATALT